jgi:hypothetical protein
MASTYSPNLALELIGNEDQPGAWGDTTNYNLGTLIEQAIAGYTQQAVTTGLTTTLTMPNGTTAVARNMFIELTGTGGLNTNLVVPSNQKLYFIYNNTTGAVTVKVSGQTGVTVPATKKMLLVCDGTDIVPAVNHFVSVTSDTSSVDTLNVTGNATVNGDVTIGGDTTFSALTANQFVALDGSKQLASTSLATSRGVGWQTFLGGTLVAPLSQIIEIGSKSQITSINIITQGGSGSCVIDLWKAPKPTIPTVANSICGTNKPTITVGTTLFSTNFTGWTTTTFNPGDLVMFYLQSSTVFTKIDVQIILQDIL